MSIHDVYDGAQFVASSMDILAQHKVMVTVGEDFGEYRQLLRKYRPDQPLGEPFDPEKQHIKPSNAFWIIGRNSQGEVIHTQAMRLIELGEETLAGYMRERFRDFPPTGLDLDLPGSRFRPGPGAKRITGNVCYHGEMWLNDSAGEYRGTGLSGVLARFAFMTCMLRWSPDYVFGFMPRPVAVRGLAEREGYMHNEPGSLRWRRRDSDQVLEGFMVWMGQEDIRHIMSMPLQELVA